MNEQIKDLAEQAKIEIEYDDFGQVYLCTAYGDDLERFARLVLEEVMQELFINGYEDAFGFLNEHFGVEE